MPECDLREHVVSRSELLKTMQHFAAIDSVGPSALRNQGKGVLARVHGYLADVSLERIPRRQTDFDLWLDQQTGNLSRRCQCKWGAARKALNLFLRSCCYHHYLREKYGFGTIEEWLEIPLDQVVASALKKKAGRGALPQWPRLVRLSKEDSVKFQAYAAKLAKDMGLPARVHLDVFLWTENR